MANEILATSQITIVDLNDQVSLSSNIVCNVPTVQFKTNTGTFIPAWNDSSKYPTLTAELYKLGFSSSSIIGSNSSVKSVSWFYKLTTQTEWTQITSNTANFSLVGTAPVYKQLKITNNIMTTQNPGISIKCEIAYQESWMTVASIQKVELPFSLNIQGESGGDSYSTILTNENQSVTCNSEGAALSGQLGPNGKAKTKVLAFKGAKALTAVSSKEALGSNKFFAELSGTVQGGGTFTKVTGKNDEFYLDGNIGESGTATIKIYFENTSNSVDKIFSYNKVKSGVSPCIAVLTNESQSIPTDPEGNNGNYTGCDTTLQLYQGSSLVPVSKITKFTFAASAGIVGSGNASTGRYVVTNMTTDTGYVDLTAEYEGSTFTRRFSISKSKGGSGENATSYWMISPAAIAKKKNGVYEPTTIKLSAMSQTGESNAVPYAGKFTIEESTDGVNFKTVYASNQNETEVVFKPTNKSARLFRANLYAFNSTVNLIESYEVGAFLRESRSTTTILDSQTIVVVMDGEDGDEAKAVTLTASNQTFVTSKLGAVTPSSITLTAALQGILPPYTVTWQKSTNGGAFSSVSAALNAFEVNDNGQEKILTLNDGAQLHVANDLIQTIPASQVTKGNSVAYKIIITKNQVNYEDTITITHLSEGSDTFTALLSNEAHIVSCDANGTPLSGELGVSGKAICEVLAYRGGTKLTNALAENATLTSMDQFKYSIALGSSYTTERFSETTGNSKFSIKTISADSGSIPITISFLNAEKKVITVKKEMTFVKSKKAIDAKSLDITGQNVFKVNGSTVTPSTITLTAEVQNVVGRVMWQVYSGSAWTALGTGNTISISPSTAEWANNMLKVKAYVEGTNIYDIMTILKVVDGVNGSSPVNLSVWAPKGRIINNSNAETIELNAMMFEGSNEITKSSAVTYKWYKLIPNTGQWVSLLTAAGNAEGWKTVIHADDIPTMLNVKCEAVYKSATYKDAITLEDKIDPIQVEIISTGGDTFKNSQGESYMYPKLLRNGEEIDSIVLIDSLPANTTGYSNNQIVYVKALKAYKKVVSNAWANATVSDLQYKYEWTKYKQNGVMDSSYSANDKVIYITSNNVEQKANFIVTVKNKDKSLRAGTYSALEPRLVYTGEWKVSEMLARSNTAIEKYSEESGSTVSFHFYGTGIKLYGDKDNTRGITNVYIDGVKERLDAYSPIEETDEILYEKDGLEEQDHTVILEVSGNKHVKAIDYYTYINKIEII